MKKLISSLLAILMTVSISVTAFAAETTAYHDDINSIITSDSISQQNTTLTLNGESTTAIYYTVPVGAKFSLTGDRSNLSQICRRVFTKQSDGTYVSTWTADYRTDGFWDATPDLAGKLVHLFAETSDENSRTLDAYFFVSADAPTTATPTSAAPTTAPTTTPTGISSNFKSDTGAKLALSAGATYQFKITSLNGKKPAFIVPGNSFKVKLSGNKGADYFFKVTATGKSGASAGVYINGSKTPSTILSIK
ncbi:hypothetical protein [Clostridium sp. KNHs216]|uniref:hypothetical protein n=1 Tax=Clostridium sp. KNHs216 TaxID=1550235 RepID=UPI001151D4A2|nr:hypothetical protein [Clostridium sp. KNHs216]TQI66762.1 hypothetical protein LY85_1435 [Clostridium sp. KNHs216]